MTTNTMTLRGQYDRKKQSSADRMIKFNLTFEEWKILNDLKGEVTCAYTNQAFDYTKGSAFNASLERINDEMGYEKGNVVWVTCTANALKNDYIFLRKDDSKLKGATKANVLRIKRILSTQENIDRMLEPYTKAFAETKTTLAEENLKAMKEKKEKEKWEQEVDFCKYYIKIAEEFKSCGVNLEETIGNLRKIVVRCKRDQITSEEFEKLEDKVLFVIDKTQPVKQGNIRVVKKNTRNALDLLTCGNSLSTISLNLHKLQNMKEK